LSLIADLYPSRNRSLAISCFTAAPTLSAIVGLGLGAWVVDTWGWRTGFYLVATPPLLISLLLALAVREPDRGRFDTGSQQSAPGLGLWCSARQLLSDNHYRKLIAACSWFSFSGLAFAMWNTPFLIRSHELSLQSAGILAGVVTGGAAALGGLFSGWLSDRLNQRSEAWLLGVPLIGTCVTMLSLVLYLLWPKGIAFALGAVDVPVAMLWCAIMGFFTMWWVAPCFNLLTRRVSPWQRATAVALQTVCTTLAGGGLGPLITGTLSDLLLLVSGEESLRHALLLVHAILLIPLFLLVQLYRQRAFAPRRVTSGAEPWRAEFHLGQRAVGGHPVSRWNSTGSRHRSESSRPHHGIHPTVGKQHGAMNEASLWRQQKPDHVGQLSRLTAAPQRGDKAAGGLAVARVLGGGLIQGRFHHAGRDYIEAHAAPGPVMHLPPHQRADRVLRTGIGHARLSRLIDGGDGSVLGAGQHQIDVRLLMRTRLNRRHRAHHDSRRLGAFAQRFSQPVKQRAYGKIVHRQDQAAAGRGHSYSRTQNQMIQRAATAFQHALHRLPAPLLGGQIHVDVAARAIYTDDLMPRFAQLGGKGGA